MLVKILYCEKCDWVKFPGAVKVNCSCKCCSMGKYFGYIEVEVDEKEVKR